jgi:hypothetical protein
MAQCGILTELEDQSRFELFQSVQEYVFSAKDKEDFLQFTESDQVHWLGALTELQPRSGGI